MSLLLTGITSTPVRRAQYHAQDRGKPCDRFLLTPHLLNFSNHHNYLVEQMVFETRCCLRGLSSGGLTYSLRFLYCIPIRFLYAAYACTDLFVENKEAPI